MKNRMKVHNVRVVFLTHVEPGENLGVPRNRKETAEEKKARKQAVKLSRRDARSQKKQLKTAFKHEEIRQRKMKAAQPTANRTVLQF